MDKFEEIIKQKVEQFEVPYNDAHWAEMDGKLNAIRSAKIKRNVLTAVGVMAVLCISSYFIFTPTTSTTNKTNTNPLASPTHTTSNEVNAVAQENTVSNEQHTTQPSTQDESIVSTDENSTVLVEENTALTNEIETSAIESAPKSETNNSSNEAKLNADFIVYNNTICLGEMVSFESVEKTASISYHWDFGDGITSKKANPKHIYKKSDTYTVTLTVKNKQTGTEATSTQNNIVNILPLPSVEFSYSELSLKHDDNKLRYPYTSFTLKKMEDDNTYTWSFGNGQRATSNAPKTIYEKAGTYQVNLNVKSANGCAAKISKEITIKNGIDLYAPKAFNPNSNITENETFIPMALLGWDVPFELIIIDQAGKIVYQTKDKNEPWNGKLNNNGLLLNEGIYGWKVSITDAEGVSHIHQGTVNLLK